MSDAQRTTTAACMGFVAIALGAFGAHGLKDILAAHDTTATWATASHYHLVHAVVLLVLALHGTEGRGVVWRRAWCGLLAGTLIFSGSLYVLSVTGIKWLGAITPIGGLLLLAGWAMLAISAGKKSEQ